MGDEVMLAEVILRLLTFDGVVFIPNYSKLSWIALSPFCDLRRPKMPILNKQARYLDEGEEY